jgi:hypothetical protein
MPRPLPRPSQTLGLMLTAATLLVVAPAVSAQDYPTKPIRVIVPFAPGEGRASPEGNSRQAAVVRTLSRVATSIRLAAVRRTARDSIRVSADVRPEGGARCVSSARRDLCGGRGAILVPTATIGTYSITSSAIASRVDGTSMPKSRAVCLLMMSSNLFGSRTGKSAGLSPLSIRPT